MVDGNPEIEESESADEPETKSDKTKTGMTAEEYNRANTAFKKRLEKKFDDRLAAKLDELKTLFQKPTDEKPNDKGDDNAAERKLVALEKRLKEVEKREKEAIQTAKVAKAQSSVQKELQGKVKEDWMDYAIEAVSKHLNITTDSPMLTIDEMDYSLSEGIVEWLKKPANKRFIPAKATVTGFEGRTTHITEKELKQMDEASRNGLVRELLKQTPFGKI